MSARACAALLLALQFLCGTAGAQEKDSRGAVSSDEDRRVAWIDEARVEPTTAGATDGTAVAQADAPGADPAQSQAAQSDGAQSDAARPKPGRVQGPPLRADLPSVDLQSRLKDVQVTSRPGGDVVTLETENGLVELSAAEYVRALANTKAAVEHGGFFYKLFNISKPWGFVWISVGFLGQLMFTFRMVLQWWASEKHKRSVVPVGFWWGSLIGGAMLFAYFVWRKDIVGIVGQSTGVFVYTRNLVLIYRGKRLETEALRTLNDSEPDPVTT